MNIWVTFYDVEKTTMESHPVWNAYRERNAYMRKLHKITTEPPQYDTGESEEEVEWQRVMVASNDNISLAREMWESYDSFEILRLYVSSMISRFRNG